MAIAVAGSAGPRLLCILYAKSLSEGSAPCNRFRADLEARLSIHNSPIRLRETSVDLRGPIARVESELDVLANRLQEWSDAPHPLS